ncbi:hypothetical protein OTU49_015524, partial [Cherax quadricarinatus]
MDGHVSVGIRQGRLKKVTNSEWRQMKLVLAGNKSNLAEIMKEVDNSPGVNGRGSSESEPEAAAAPSKRGPKTSATTIPKSTALPSNPQRKTGPKPVVRPQQAATQKTPGKTQPQKTSVAVVQQKKSAQKKALGSGSASSTDKASKKKSIFSPDNSTDSESETKRPVSKKGLQPKPQTKLQPKPQPKAQPKTSAVQKSSTQQRKGASKVNEKVSEKSSESSTNSSTASSESDSDSSSESSASAKSLSDKPVIQQIVRRKSQTKSTPATTESDKEEEEEEDDEDEADTPRKHVTRSSSVRTKRGSLLGLQKGTESDSENN